MADRFEKLLQKSKTGKLTAKEEAELAAFLNAPLLEELEEPSPRFVSKQEFQSTDIAARVKAIEWFAHCGEPTEFNLSMEIERVKSWPQAIKACKGRAWETATLEAQNQLTLFLHGAAMERYRKWNDLIKQCNKVIVDPMTKKVWEPFRAEHDLDAALIQSLKSTIRGMWMANSYLDLGHGTHFYLELLTVYEAGHLPCGWKGKWPEGQLVVF